MRNLTTGVLLMGDLPAKELVSLARRIEEWGYDYLWLADERFFREVYSSLTLCALNTTRIKLGPCVTDPYSRHPALTAQAIATLDEISEGRAMLGIGAGVSGFAELGIERSRPALAIREAISLVRGLLAGETVDYQGRTIRLNHGALNFLPPRADLPVYVASNSPRGLQLAGELANGAIVSSCVTSATVGYALGLIAEGAAKTGRSIDDLDRVARLNCCICPDRQEALNGVRLSAIRSLITYTRFAAAAGVEFPASLLDSLAEVGYTHDLNKLESLARQVPNHIVEESTLVGTVEDVTARVVNLSGWGISQIIVRPSATPQHGIDQTLKAFATQVMPAVRQQIG